MGEISPLYCGFILMATSQSLQMHRSSVYLGRTHCTLIYYLTHNAMGTQFEEAPEGFRWVFCRYIKRNGKVIYPKKGKCFRFLVEA